jgi:HSP20 family protein
MNRLFDDFFYPTYREDSDLGMLDWNPVADIYDNEDHLVIKAELPGVDKKDIVVDVKEGVLTLKGERSYDNEVKEDKYYRKERTFGRFERSFTLPVNVEAEKIKADFKDGILKIEIPKPETQKPKKITIH